MIFMVIPSQATQASIPLIMMLVLFLNKKQFVSVLLALELMVCMMFLKVSMKSQLMSFSFSVVILFMCVMVCEAMLGIGILISTVRTKGNNLMTF